MSELLQTILMWCGVGIAALSTWFVNNKHQRSVGKREAEIEQQIKETKAMTKAIKEGKEIDNAIDKANPVDARRVGRSFMQDDTDNN